MGIPLTLLEATQAIYRQGLDGEPVLESGRILSCAEKLRLTDEPIERETWPTAEAEPKAHHLGMRYGIEIEKLWKVEGSEPFDYRLELDQKYVLVIVWQEERGRLWYKRTYYGVTDKGMSLDQAVQPLRPGQTINWRAERMVETGGTLTQPNYNPAGQPLRVRWAGNDGQFWLFAYDATSRGFTEITAGSSAGRAAIVNTDDYAVTIEGERAWWAESGIFVCHELIEAPGIAAALDLPRLEFWRGEQRLASISKAGTLRVFELSEEDIDVPAAGFQLVAGGVVRAVLNQDGLTATALAEV